jgi:two-component system phosphate regulon response regulator PhoB
LIVLEVTALEGASLELGKSLRRDPATSAIPLLLIATAGDLDRVLGSELAPDDFVTKPFRPPELVLRIKELLRRDRLRDGKAPRIRLGKLSVDIPRHEVTVNGHQIDLTATELKLITLLAQRRGLVQSRDQLLRDVWEHESFTDTRTVDTHMCRLRDKMGSAAKYIETIRGFGYRFAEE